MDLKSKIFEVEDSVGDSSLKNEYCRNYVLMGAFLLVYGKLLRLKKNVKCCQFLTFQGGRYRHNFSET